MLSDGITAVSNISPAAKDGQSDSEGGSLIADESGPGSCGGKEPLSSSLAGTNFDELIAEPLILLLVEDNPPDVLLMLHAIKMESLPLQVHLAKDGERAVHFIAAVETVPGAPVPHLLLLDLNLPKIHGIHVLRRLRASAKFRETPVLVVTSSDSQQDRLGVAQLGASYFQKPTTYDEFLNVGTVLRQFLNANGLL